MTYGYLIDNLLIDRDLLTEARGYAQALIQNQMINYSTLIKLWNGSSIADITRSIEADREDVKEGSLTKCGERKTV